MPMLPITSFYGAILTMLVLKMAFNVIKVRQSHQQGLGFEQKDLLLAGRIHGNAMEYIPISLILLALAELNGLPSMVIHIVGFTLVLARIIHAVGFNSSQGGSHPGRYWGTLLTWLVMFILAAGNIIYSWHYLF
jgi:uncharacterized membrane protein YecN with MAPEG domain